jgi:hypothetical protein
VENRSNYAEELKLLLGGEPYDAKSTLERLPFFQVVDTVNLETALVENLERVGATVK